LIKVQTFFVTLAIAFALTSSEKSSFAQSTATAYFVAPTGNDSNPGTQTAPWKTIQKAARSATPGSTVNVRAGIYSEMVNVAVSGSATGGFITFQSFPGETAVIDGTNITVGSGGHDVLLMQDRSYLRWKGFELRNFRTSQSGNEINGVSVYGTSHHIELLGNKIHNIETNVTSQSGGNAHGIVVLGTSSAQAITDVVIDGNEVYSLRTGTSESITLNGNVTNFKITNNVVHDNNNIGIDMAGHYGVCPTAACDQVRSGIASGNRVYNIDASYNPAYGGNFTTGGGGHGADGIYVDGGRDIIIERNVVTRADIGIEMASEHGGQATSFITVRDNVVIESANFGIAIGGYDTDRGSTNGCKILNNTLFNNGTLGWGSDIEVQFDTRDNVIKNNVVYGNGKGYFIHNQYVQNTNNVVDYNLFFASAGTTAAQFMWKGQSYQGFAAYQKTANDVHSLWANPMFVNETALDLHLKAASPAIGRGDTTVIVAGEMDLDGEPRAQGSAVEMGADEVSAAGTPPVVPPTPPVVPPVPPVVPPVPPVVPPVTPAPMAPTAPSGLIGSAVQGQVTLRWTDNARDESTYKVERKPAGNVPFVEVAVLAANTTSWVDQIAPGTYSYRVRAVNAAGASAYSNVVDVTATVPTTADVVGRRPALADAFVRSGSAYAGRNFGGWATLDLQDIASSSGGGNGFVRFSLASIVGTVVNAKVRLYGATSAWTASAPASVSLFQVASNTWGEGTVTWNDSPTGGPAMGAQVDASKAVPLGSAAEDRGQYIEWDVTAYVNALKLAGATQISFGAKVAPGAGNASVSFKTREMPTNPPELVITTR
jgi:hypothetical protein